MERDSSSFRDSDGHVFESEEVVYRSIAQSYLPHFNFLNESNLLEILFEREFLVRHQVIDFQKLEDFGLACGIIPERIKLISYPYEWCFSQLKAAALLTLEILKLSLEHGMILKDGSAFNIQFKGCSPILIDTLSFAIYEENQPWYGYKQFCQHFLNPLCIWHYANVDSHLISKSGLDGVPLRLASKILPFSTLFNLIPLFHIHLHASAISSRLPLRRLGLVSSRISKRNLVGMVLHLTDFIQSLRIGENAKSYWLDYEATNPYRAESRRSKEEIVSGLIERVNPSLIWDIGAHDGHFSRIASKSNRTVLSLDSDPLILDLNFNLTKTSGVKNVYSLIYDVTNPSCDMGWANNERKQLLKRAKPDLLLVLALIHHLVIVDNIPFRQIAEYFGAISKWLILEFIPPDDFKVIEMPSGPSKNNYSRANFEDAFFNIFHVVSEIEVKSMKRTIFLLQKK